MTTTLWRAQVHSKRVFYVQEVELTVHWFDLKRKKYGTFFIEIHDVWEVDIDPSNDKWKDAHVIGWPCASACMISVTVTRGSVFLASIESLDPNRTFPSAYGTGYAVWVMLLKYRGEHPVDGQYGNGRDWVTVWSFYHPSEGTERKDLVQIRDPVTKLTTPTEYRYSGPVGAFHCPCVPGILIPRLPPRPDIPPPSEKPPPPETPK